MKISSYEELSGPALPQMANDGYITEIELYNDGGIIVEVYHYSTAEKGDYLNLYWDGSLFNTLSLGDPDTYPWPWVTVVPVEAAPDGPHQTWYTVTDAAQNPSASPISMGIVDRNHTDGLPPPVFLDTNAQNTITWDSVVQQNGTHIHVPWTNDSFNIGDTVYVYWRELTSQGIPIAESETNIVHTAVAQDLTNGFDVLIPAAFVSAITSTGTAEAWYSVIPLTDIARSSKVATANVNMTGTGSYPPPVIPAGNDGWIDCQEITTEGIDILVPANNQFQPGAVVSVFWQGYDDAGNSLAETYYEISHTLSQNDVLSGFTVEIPTADITLIGIGYAQAWYQVFEPAVPGVSQIAKIMVDSEHCSLLPAPVFPAAAGDNTITNMEVDSANGTDMNISYPGMESGDTITAYWFGYKSSPETPVAGTNWTETRALTQNETQAQKAVFHIPAENIIPVDNGYGEGRYQVMFNSGGIASSATTDVVIKTEEENSMMINCSTGAPYFEPTVAIRPVNTVLISGSPGTDVELSLPVSSGAWFNPAGVQTLLLRLDGDGMGYAEVYSFSTGNVLVSAYEIDNPAMNASASMTFTDWLNGRGELQYYGISTGAVADSQDVCSVWMKISSASSATQAKLTLTGTNSAIIPSSGTKTAYVNVSLNHVASFDVSDSVAEAVTFTLSLPYISDSYVTGTLSFSTLATESIEQEI